jgi:hypothetical protein
MKTGISEGLFIENFLVNTTNPLEIGKYFPTLGAFGLDKE